MDRQYTVIVSKRAASMLFEHVDFLAQVSEIAATRLIEEFEEKANSLKHMPDRNPFLEPIALSKEAYRKILLCKRYQIVYQVLSDNTVYIAYVIDCRQDNSWLIF